MGIKNLKNFLPEVGKIKIGGKGAERTAKNGNKYRLPIRYDHFVITTRERDETDNLVVNKDIMKILGPTPRELRIMLIYDDIDLNFRTSYQFYEGKKKRCEGDGETAIWFSEDGTNRKGKCDPETCKHAQEEKKGARKCKISGVLTCILLDYPTLGGVFRFRTHGFYSVSYMLNSLKYLSTATNGLLRNIPLKMRYENQQTEEHGTVPAITMVFDKEMNELRQLVSQEIKIRKELGYDIKTEEQKALEVGIIDDAETDADIQEEYYPEIEDADYVESEIPAEKGSSPDDIKKELKKKSAVKEETVKKEEPVKKDSVVDNSGIKTDAKDDTGQAPGNIKNDTTAAVSDPDDPDLF